MSEQKLFSRAEVTKMHTEKKLNYFIIHNNVYDVTKFLGEHPGGEEVLMEQAGKDATENFEDVGHSSDARELMKQYKVGEVIEEERREVTDPNQPWAADDQATAGSNSSSNSWLLPLALGIIATIIYRLLFA